jgi:hypothetical protein
MISAITLVDCTDDEWLYQILYKNKRYEAPYSLPFEEMSVLEQERFIGEMHSLAFQQERVEKLDQRPKEFLEDLGIEEEEEGEDEDEDD